MALGPCGNLNLRREGIVTPVLVPPLTRLSIVAGFGNAVSCSCPADMPYMVNVSVSLRVKGSTAALPGTVNSVDDMMIAPYVLPRPCAQNRRAYHTKHPHAARLTVYAVCYPQEALAWGAFL